jgi:hypothetical protein
MFSRFGLFGFGSGGGGGGGAVHAHLGKENRFVYDELKMQWAMEGSSDSDSSSDNDDDYYDDDDGNGDDFNRGEIDGRFAKRSDGDTGCVSGSGNGLGVDHVSDSEDDDDDAGYFSAEIYDEEEDDSEVEKESLKDLEAGEGRGARGAENSGITKGGHRGNSSSSSSRGPPEVRSSQSIFPHLKPLALPASSSASSSSSPSKSNSNNNLSRGNRGSGGSGGGGSPLSTGVLMVYVVWRCLLIACLYGVGLLLLLLPQQPSLPPPQPLSPQSRGHSPELPSPLSSSSSSSSPSMGKGRVVIGFGGFALLVGLLLACRMVPGVVRRLQVIIENNSVSNLHPLHCNDGCILLFFFYSPSSCSSNLG